MLGRCGQAFNVLAAKRVEPIENDEACSTRTGPRQETSVIANQARLRRSQLRFYSLRKCGVNPSFRRDEMQNKSDPEGGAEEFARRQAGERAGGEEDPDDGANGGDGKADRICSNHPLPMQDNFTPADVPHGLV